MVWTDSDRVVPCDYRASDKATDGLTKNDHFLAMLRQAKDRGFEPACVLFDSWYSGLENLWPFTGVVPPLQGVYDRSP